MLTCVTIDDEPLARECIVNYINETPFLQSLGSGTNPIELTHLMDQHEIDLIFLDIQMPIINGIEYLKTKANLPMVIITTAYPNYAIEGFQLDVLDYLVKPITFHRFLKAANKARDYHQLRNKPLLPAGHIDYLSDYFFVKCEYKYERIYYDDILYVQALQNYVVIFTTKGKHMTLLTLKHVEDKLDQNDFIRVHKSYIASVSKIESIENSEITIQSHRIPLSRSHYQLVLDRVVNDRLWEKDKPLPR